MKVSIPSIPRDWLVVWLLAVFLGAIAFLGLLTEVVVLLLLAVGILALLFYRSPGSLVGWMMVAAPLIAYRGPMDVNPFRVLLSAAFVVMGLIIATRPSILRWDTFLVVGLFFLLKQCQAFAASEHMEFAKWDLALHAWGMVAMATASFLIQFGRVKPSQLSRYFLAAFTLVVALNFYEIVQRSVFHKFYVTLPYSTVTVATLRQIVPGLYRSRLPLATPNHLASYCAVALLVVAGIIRARGTGGVTARLRLWAVLLMPPLMVSFLCTFSRSGIVNLFVAAAYLFGGKRGGAGLRTAVVVLVILLAGLILALSIISVIFGFEPATFLDRITLRGLEGRGLSDHLRWKELAIDLWLKNPILGAGLHNYGPYAGQPEGTSRAHSVYFTVLAESGILGLLLFVLFVISLFRMASRAIGAEPDQTERLLLCHMTAAFVGFVTSSVFYDFFVDQEWWWLYMGILHGFASLRLREDLREPQTAGLLPQKVGYHHTEK